MLAMLLELQSLEDDLRDLRRLKDELAKLNRENVESSEVFETMLAERADLIGQTRAFCTEKEAEIKEAEESTRRSRARLTNITSQRELTALNKELDAARKSTQQRSEELLKLMEQLEAAEKDYAQKEGEFTALGEQMTHLEADLKTRIAERESQAKDHRTRQAAIRKNLDRSVVARFDRILGGRDGWAVARMTSNVCKGCRMEVTPQQYIRLQRMETLEACAHCKRLLVWDAEAAAAESEDAPADA